MKYKLIFMVNLTSVFYVTVIYRRYFKFVRVTIFSEAGTKMDISLIVGTQQKMYIKMQIPSYLPCTRKVPGLKLGQGTA